MRTTVEAVLGAVIGASGSPESLLLGRYDQQGRLRFFGRTTRLGRDQARAVAEALTPAGCGHPWTGRTFASRWGRTPPSAAVSLVEPTLVAEVSADVALEPGGGWRHLVRFQRLRLDMRPDQVPLAGSHRGG